MPRREPERSGITWSDVQMVMSTYCTDYGVRPMFEVHFIPAPKMRTYVEVVLYEAHSTLHPLELVRIRSEFSMAKPAGQAGQVMHALYLAINEYDRNPWLWTPERRALTTGESI